MDRLLQRHADALAWADMEGAPAANLTLALAPVSSRRIADDRWEHPQKARRLCAEIDGFLLYARTSVAAEDRVGPQGLCRYGLRSSFALSGLSLLDDGRVCYRLKRPWPGPGGVTQLVLDPVDFLGWLAKLLPLPRSDLIRYHGAFAPTPKHPTHITNTKHPTQVKWRTKWRTQTPKHPTQVKWRTRPRLSGEHDPG